MIQILLHGQKMDPLVSLYYFAPVCAAINICILPFTEGLAPIYNLHLVGAPILLSNALLSFALNVSAVFLVGAGSGLVLTLAGVLKVRFFCAYDNLERGTNWSIIGYPYDYRQRTHLRR